MSRTTGPPSREWSARRPTAGPKHFCVNEAQNFESYTSSDVRREWPKFGGRVGYVRRKRPVRWESRREIGRKRKERRNSHNTAFVRVQLHSGRKRGFRDDFVPADRRSEKCLFFDQINCNENGTLIVTVVNRF